MFKEVSQLTNELILMEDNWFEAKRIVDDLSNILKKVACLEEIEANQRIITNYGDAISIHEAAHCLLEFSRTQQFFLGLNEAIRDARVKFPNDVIHILYAGIGPFATLMLSAAALYNPDEIQFTLIEINEDTIKSAKKVIHHFELDPFVEALIHADASTINLESKGKHHILITETMQQALRKEPQVKITLNLLPQMHPECILIPENILIDLAVIDSNKNMSRMMGNLDYVDNYYLSLGNILQFNKQSAMELINRYGGQISSFECNSIYCSEQIPQSYNEVYYMTTIQVYGPFCIAHYQCSLTLPYRVFNTSKNVDKGNYISFYYNICASPGLVLSQSKLCK